MGAYLPRPPSLPRDDSLKPPTVERIEVSGLIPLTPAESSRLAQTEIAATAALAATNSLGARLDSLEATIPRQIKQAVDVHLDEVKSHLGRQDVEGSRQRAMLTEILDLAREREAGAQRKKLDSLHMSSEEDKVFSGKQRNVRLWVKTFGVIVGILVALGSAAGISQCEHAKVSAEPASK